MAADQGSPVFDSLVVVTSSADTRMEPVVDIVIQNISGNPYATPPVLSVTTDGILVLRQDVRFALQCLERGV